MKKYIQFAGVLFIFLVIGMSIGSLPPAKSQDKTPVKAVETKKTAGPGVCVDGATAQCKSGACDGSRVCKNGQWSECYITKKCIPGSKTSCSENGCAVGHKTCNECGTDYGDCVKDNNK